jgi:transcriptional regulator, MarR family
VLLDHRVSKDLHTQILSRIEKDGQVRVRDLYVWNVGPRRMAAHVTVEDPAPRPPEHYKSLLDDVQDLNRITVEVHSCPCPAEEHGHPCAEPAMHDLERLSDLTIEFYEKLSSWEQAVVRDSSITLPQMHTLEILGQQSPLRMKELAAKMGVTTGTLTVGVDRLEKQGLVTRIPHETDRRSILVALTEAGRSSTASIMPTTCT